MNPADIASRGAKGSELHKLELWLHCPKFLCKDEKNWLEQPSQLPELSQDDSECRKCPGRGNVILRSEILESLLSRFSSWDSLRKAIAWLVRFKNYLVGLLNKDPDSIPKGPLTDSEVINAESVIVKVVQHDKFPVELALVGQKTAGDQKKCVPRTSLIRNLNPFVADEVLRVGGRLENAPISFQTKHPVTLPSKHHVTNLIIQQKARPGEQIMAPLPLARVAPTDPPFTHVGVDYFGHLFVKQGRSQVKRYGCLFTCLTMGRGTSRSHTHWKQTPSSVRISVLLAAEGSPRKYTATTALISLALSES